MGFLVLGGGGGGRRIHAKAVVVVHWGSVTMRMGNSEGFSARIRDVFHNGE